MVDIPIKVYILKHFSALEDRVPFCNAAKDEFNPAAFEGANAFAQWLSKESEKYGTLFPGFMQEIEDGVESNFLLCLQREWPAIHKRTDLRVRLATGEIFLGADFVYFAESNSLIAIDGEVLNQWYGNEQGLQIPDLDADVQRRLAKVCSHGCRAKGYNGAIIRELIPKFIATANKRKPCEWEWEWLEKELGRIIEAFEYEVQSQRARWLVYEALETDRSSPTFPPFVDGEIVKDVIEALVDEPNVPRQWLVHANPMFLQRRMHRPEFETIRALERNEIFTSRRGVFWNRPPEGVWLGEIAGDMFHERHGEIVADVEDSVHEHLVQGLIEQLEKRDYFQDPALVLETIHKMLGRQRALEMWFQDIEDMTEQLMKALKAAL